MPMGYIREFNCDLAGWHIDKWYRVGPFYLIDHGEILECRYFADKDLAIIYSSSIWEGSNLDLEVEEFYVLTKDNMTGYPLKGVVRASTEKGMIIKIKSKLRAGDGLSTGELRLLKLK